MSFRSHWQNCRSYLCFGIFYFWSWNAEIVMQMFIFDALLCIILILMAYEWRIGCATWSLFTSLVSQSNGTRLHISWPTLSLIVGGFCSITTYWASGCWLEHWHIVAAEFFCRFSLFRRWICEWLWVECCLQHSGLSDSIATFLSQFRTLPDPAIVFLVSCMAVFCTAFTSNVATATLLIPIAAELVRYGYMVMVKCYSFS